MTLIQELRLYASDEHLASLQHGNAFDVKRLGKQIDEMYFCNL